MIVATLFLLGALMLLNALYVAAEFAAVAARPSRIQHEAEAGGRKAASLLRVLQSPAQLDRYISACQLGITVTSIAVGAVSQATLSVALVPVLVDFGIASRLVAASVATVGVLFAMSILQLVLAEQVPKSIALHAPNRVALRTFVPVQFTLRILGGFITMLNGSAQGLLRLVGVSAATHQHVHSAGEIEQLIGEGVERGLMSAEDQVRLGQALMLGNRTARKLMVPRPQVVAIDESMLPDAAVELVTRTPHTRIPVYRESIDQIVGLIHAKDLVAHFVVADGLPSFEKILRPCFTVHEGTTADRLISLMRENRAQMAIVLDEFGGTAGLVTLEDVLAEVFGDVADEFSPVHAAVERLADGRIRLPGLMRLDEAAELVGVPWTAEAATVGGFVVERLGHLPERGEVVEADGARIEIEQVSQRVVDRLLVTPPAAPATDASEEHDG